MPTLSAHARRRVPGISLMTALLVAPLLGCSKDNPTSTAAPSGSASAVPSGPVVDSELGAAIASAEKGHAAPAGSGAEEGPPPGGIFPDGAADEAFAKGARPKLELMSEGSAPRFSLAPAAAATKQEIDVTVGLSQGQQALPTLTYTLAVKAEADPSRAEARRLTFEVRKVTPALQPGLALPPQLGQALPTLKGTKVELTLWADGGVSDASLKVAAGAPEGIAPLVENLADGLTGLTAPVPGKDVGAGAYWMVTDRAAAAGIDAVRYRVVRVERIDDKGASLSVETRKYAASSVFATPGAGANGKLTLRAFDAHGKGTIELAHKLLPTAGELTEQLRAQVQPDPNDPRVGVLQVDSKAQLASP